MAPEQTPSATPGWFVRFFFLSWIAYFRTVFDPEFASVVARARRGPAALAPPPREEPRAPSEPAPHLRQASPDSALQLLALLQRAGRLIDFLEEDVAGFSDAQIGAAARVVHEGCRKALREHVPVEPIRDEQEGSPITLPKGFDARAIRLSGRVEGEPPYRGTLVHRGWRARKVELPKMSEGHDPSILAPAEVEL